ncbi:MAG: FAD-binding protein [Steroidobacteraceae bacterium]|nr:FAD-binding protein [Steroidobacteraceae bacterium]
MASLQSIKHWDDETDVLIAGYGVAGCAAAIEAHDSDSAADILIVEKMPAERAGGNGRVSGQSLLISHNAEALYRYQKAMSSTNPPPDDMLREWARQMAGLEAYIEARIAEAGNTELVKGSGWSSGEAVYEFPEFGAEDAVAYNAFVKPIPGGVWITMRTCVEKRPRIRHAFESPLVDLVQDPDTLEVFGAIVETRGVRRAIRARRGVIVAVGGYEADMDMQRNYYGLAEAWPLGTPANTGDGVRILQKAGAELWHMRNFGQSGGIWPGIKVPDYPTIFMRRHFWQTFSWIEIGADDQRFYNEGAELYYTHYKERHHGHWVDTPHWRVGPVHMLFDENVRQHNCLVTHAMGWNTVVEGYEWSDDNSVEVGKGWIVKADTIEALAQQLGRDPARVGAAVARYNEACARGADADFGRPAWSLQPLATPPFYAVRIDPAIVCTSGGAKRNILSQVLDPRGNAIARLHEAGELGSMISHLYQNGSYLTEAMISGRAAGRSAVTLPAWQAAQAA